METKEGVTYADLTPEWVGLLPLYIHFLRNGTMKQKAFAEGELNKMAKLADAYVALSKEKKG